MDNFKNETNYSVVEMYKSCPDGIESILQNKLNSLNEEIIYYENFLNEFKKKIKYDDVNPEEGALLKWQYVKNLYINPWLKNYYVIPDLHDVGFQKLQTIRYLQNVLKLPKNKLLLVFTKELRADRVFVRLYGTKATEQQWKNFCKINKLHKITINQDWKQKIIERNKIQTALNLVKVLKGDKLSLPPKNNLQEKYNIVKEINILKIAQALNFKIKHNKINCPFHDDKTPSLSFHPEKNFFYCFGCGKAGDGIKFVECLYDMSFQSAVEFIYSMYYN